MNPFLIRSDRWLIRSDEYTKSSLDSSPQTPAQTRARLAAGRTATAWFTDRDLQTMRPAELPLRRWIGTRAEAIFGHQSARWAPAKGLHTKRSPSTSRPVRRQLPQAARNARRDLCNQHGTSPTPRGSWIDRYGPGTRRLRSCQGWRHPRRHGRVLSCCRRPAVRSGGAR